MSNAFGIFTAFAGLPDGLRAERMTELQDTLNIYFQLQPGGTRAALERHRTVQHVRHLAEQVNADLARISNSTPALQQPVQQLTQRVDRFITAAAALEPLTYLQARLTRQQATP